MCDLYIDPDRYQQLYHGIRFTEGAEFRSRGARAGTTATTGAGA